MQLRPRWLLVLLLLVLLLRLLLLAQLGCLHLFAFPLQGSQPAWPSHPLLPQLSRLLFRRRQAHAIAPHLMQLRPLLSFASLPALVLGP